MKFKTFINEEFNLDNMGLNLDRLFANKYFKKQSYDFLNNTASPALSFQLPNNVTEIPQHERTGKIVTLLGKRNPIYIRLSDGTEANFTYDEWIKIKGEPAIGKTMKIIFQRHPEDRSKNHSKIEQVIVMD